MPVLHFILDYLMILLSHFELEMVLYIPMPLVYSLEEATMASTISINCFISLVDAYIKITSFGLSSIHSHALIFWWEAASRWKIEDEEIEKTSF